MEEASIIPFWIKEILRNHICICENHIPLSVTREISDYVSGKKIHNKRIFAGFYLPF